MEEPLTEHSEIATLLLQNLSSSLIHSPIIMDAGLPIFLPVFLYLWEKWQLKVISDWWSHVLFLVFFFCRESTTIPIFTAEDILLLWMFARTNWTITHRTVTHFMREFQFVVRCPKPEMRISSIHWKKDNHMVTEFPLLNYKLQRTYKIFSAYTHKWFQISP